MRLDLLARLNAERRARRAAALVTPLTGGEVRLVTAADLAGDLLGEEIAARFRSGQSGIVETEEGEAFLTISVPPPRLVVIGAVHITQALAPMASTAGFDVTIIDPRTAFATPERFPDAVLLDDWPEDVLKKRPLDAYTALAAVTHDPKIDDYPIISALKGGCFYVGALGSRKTHAKRVERLTAAGLSSVEIARICAPIGLDIGARSPAEIAVSVLAQVIGALRKGETLR